MTILDLRLHSISYFSSVVLDILIVLDTLRLGIPAIGMILVCHLQLVVRETTLKENTPKEPRVAYSTSVTFVMHNVVFAFLVIEKVQL